MTDYRDGRVYRIVTIGEGDSAQTWMAENLNYSDSAKASGLKGRSWCYNNDKDNCDTVVTIKM